MDIVLVALYLAAQVRVAAIVINTRVICLRDSPLKIGLMAVTVLVAAGWMAWSTAALWAEGPASLLGLGMPMSPGRWALWGWLVASLAFLVVGTARSLWLRAATRERQQPASRRTAVALPPGLARGPSGLLARLDDAARLEITQHEWRLPRLPAQFDGLSVVQVSDLHYAPHLAEALERIFYEIERLQPDLIALTGDFVTRLHDLPGLAGPLARLRAPLGAYAVTGNHDWWTDVAEVERVLGEGGVRLLRNEYVALRRDDAALYLSGVDDLWSPTHDLARALDGIPRDGFVLLLAHNPDEIYQVPPERVDLILSGHTHGGQVTLPLIGPLVVPCRSAQFAHGLHRARGALLYINRGLGAGAPFRFRCKPEVTHITLRAGAGAGHAEGPSLAAPSP